MRARKLTAAAALVTVLTYRTAPGEASLLDRAVLIALRLCLVGVVLFCLFRPVLILRAAVPQQNFLGVLLDDSRSMRVADQNDKPRSEFEFFQKHAVPRSFVIETKTFSVRK